LVTDLGFSASEVRSAFASVEQGGRPQYLYRHRQASASLVEGIRRFRGVHLQRVFLRNHPSGELAADLLGTLVADSGRGRSGFELSLDSLLQGTPGEAGFLRAPNGTLFESPDRRIRDPVPGHDVVLTLDAELQGIAEAALAETLLREEADAGDVVLLEPLSGEVLAMATVVRRPEGARRAGGWIPAEPGSTIKLLAAGGLLRLARASGTDSVHGENGEWTLQQRRRPIRDIHPIDGYMTLAHAIQVSSNIGATKFTMRLTPEEHFDVLRDFGLGTLTGVELPYESPGLLKFPHRWNPDNTQPSMAQGYELEVTPLQLAAAYAAIANDGWLPALTLVKEVRDAKGATIYRHEPEAVRRVVSARVAGQLRDFLREAAADSGTGSAAQLDTYGVLGKTGTARNVVDGVYAPGNYTASFAGIFPADDPQLVVVVRIVNPQGGEYYGGLIAAPMTRRMLQDALATRQSTLDRSRLSFRTARAAPPASVERAVVSRTVVDLTAIQQEAQEEESVVVPDVKGLSLREAAFRLHQRGLRVSVSGSGPVVTGSSPGAGTSVRSGVRVSLGTGPES
jgi:cell division protein FtsI (penicillin-binding protein 3)